MSTSSSSESYSEASKSALASFSIASLFKSSEVGVSSYSVISSGSSSFSPYSSSSSSLILSSSSS
jgi:hypothetical protein